MNTDIVNELLDDDAFDPKKLFNQDEYSTLLIKREGFSKSQNSSADLLEGLLKQNITRSETEAIFSKLKEVNAGKLMIDAINSAQRIDEKVLITTACWESGIDFTNDFLFFAQLSCHDNFNLSLEALTVLENIEGTIDEQTLAKALTIAQSKKYALQTLNKELIKIIKDRGI
jgi:hypothetical protein